LAALVGALASVLLTSSVAAPPTLVVSSPAYSSATFKDVAPNVGIDGFPNAPLYGAYLHSASWGDVDNDGWIDLFSGTFVQGVSQVSNKLLLNKNGVFQDAGQPAIQISGRAAGSVFADFDNDGDLDLFISNNRIVDNTPTSIELEPSRILRNDGGILGFVDVTSGSGIEAQTRNGRQVTVLDYNHDGLLDLFIVADALRGSGPTLLLKNSGNFKFEDATTAAGLPSDIKGLGLAIGDVTGDGWPDLFVAGGTATSKNLNYMFIANRNGTYRKLNSSVFDWTPFVKGNEDWVSSGAFGDLNRDGRLDLLVGHHFGTAAEVGPGVPLRVYMNRGLNASGDPVFEDITVQAGLPNIDSKSPHVEIQDFNNDGWMDLYTSVRIDTPDGFAPLIFTHQGNVGDPTFTAPNLLNLHYYAAGPVADFNRDGKLDVFLAEWRSVLNQGAVPSMLMQNTGITGNWLQVRVGTAANPMGIGAKVMIYKQGTLELLGTKEISPAYGFSSSQPSIAHFGLGSETAVDVAVIMPFGGTHYKNNSVPANGSMVIPNASTVEEVTNQAPGVNAGGDATITLPATTVSLELVSKAPNLAESSYEHHVSRLATLEA
jgi:hypothetical protein